MDLQIRIVFLFMVLLLFSGCAGLQGKNMAQAIPDDPLRSFVPESFHLGVEAQETRSYLSTVDPDGLSPDRRLEVAILKGLSGVSDEKDLFMAFDALWDKEKGLREVLKAKGKRSEFIYPAAEIYYLLSSFPAATWQNEASERIYAETLSSLRPDELSGYALHFYTLALLKTGRFDAAYPFLLRLEHFTRPEVYLEDLKIALRLASAKGASGPSSRIMACIQSTCKRYDLTIPEKEIEMAKWMSRPQTKNKEQAKGKDMVKHIAGKEPIQKGVGVKAAGLSGPRVVVKVQIIRASRRDTFLDPALSALAQDLKKTLNFTGFTLTGEKTLRLRLGQTGDLSLPDGHLLQITPRGLTGGKARIEVAVRRDGRELLHTFIVSVDRGSAIIGSPRGKEDETLLLRIITLLS